MRVMGWGIITTTAAAEAGRKGPGHAHTLVCCCCVCRPVGKRLQRRPQLQLQRMAGSRKALVDEVGWCGEAERW